jgi:hypothetical protein
VTVNPLPHGLKWSTECKRTVHALADQIHQPNLQNLIRRFLYDQLHEGNDPSSSDVDISMCPQFYGRISVFYSATATYYAPCDLSGIGGMRREWIRATPSWQKSTPRYDCVLVNTDSNLSRMQGLDVVRILLFFSLEFQQKEYPCALVQWYTKIGGEPNSITGMWVVEREMKDGEPVVSVIHLDCIMRAAHLIPVYGDGFIPVIDPSDTLDTFDLFSLNKYVDHHAFEIIT